MAVVDLRSGPQKKNPYEPLLEGQIRLLTILSNHGEPVVCELYTYSLAEAPEYDIVSYCWGDELEMNVVTCNSVALLIRTTLSDSLHYIVGNRPKPLRPLWIDAICLNQDDYDEKAVQVPLMGSFYRHAARCIVRFGTCDEDLYVGKGDSISEFVLVLEIMGSA